MSPLSRILAATDLSAPSRHAIDRGFRIAAELKASYTVLHAIELDLLDSLLEALGDSSSGVKKRLEEDARQTLDQMLADPARHLGQPVRPLIVSGGPLETIAAHAQALNVDLLVLGARGEGFLRHALLGSTASRLLRKIGNCPVLVVKQQPHEAYRRLLIPVDFSAASAEAIRVGRLLAPQADIVLLHAFELPFEGRLAYAGIDESIIQDQIRLARHDLRQRLYQLAESAGLRSIDYSALVIHGDPSQQIIVQEQEQNCDLIVMGKHGKHLAEALLLGSVTKHILAESQCDVLAITDHAASQPIATP